MWKMPSVRKRLACVLCSGTGQRTLYYYAGLRVWKRCECRRGK